MPRRLAQQRMTLSDLEWPFHAWRAISAVAELLVSFVTHFVTETDCVAMNRLYTKFELFV